MKINFTFDNVPKFFQVVCSECGHKPTKKEIEDCDFCNECEEMFNYPDEMFDVPDHLRMINHPDDPRNLKLKIVKWVGLDIERLGGGQDYLSKS